MEVNMKYIGKKLITLIMTLLIISFLVFLAFSVIPGDPALSKLGTEASPEALTALREEMGLNQPLLVRYGKWLAGIVRGDFGSSYHYQMPVSSMIVDKIPITVVLACMAFVLMLAISIPLGIYMAKHDGKAIDRIFTIINQLIMSVPHFFMGIILSYVFGLVLKWFTPGGFVNYKDNMGGFVKYLIFPAIAIALPKAAMSVKLLKSAIMEEAKKDYVRTAYSRGNDTGKVLVSHVLKNALIPNITFWGMTLADMVVGSIVMEHVFNIPGIGSILLTSISHRDYPVVQAIIVLIATVVMVSNFVVDLIYQKIDPRITIE